MTSVYVIAAEGGPVKIGIAKNPQGRLRELGTGTPFRLRLAHVEDPGDLPAIKVERAAHLLLSAHRTHGEWFSVTVDVAIEAIKKGCDYVRNPSPKQKKEKVVYSSTKEAFPLPCLVRAARNLLSISQSDLAKRCHVGLSTLVDFETEKRMISGKSLHAIQSTLESTGIRFVPDTGRGPGVEMADPSGNGEWFGIRLRNTSRTVASLA